MKKLLGKLADRMLVKQGFVKKEESNLYVAFVKQHENYTQKIAIGYKAEGPAIVQSYDPNLFDDKNIGNTCVGLTAVEMLAICIKIKSKGWK